MNTVVLADAGATLRRPCVAPISVPNPVVVDRDVAIVGPTDPPRHPFSDRGSPVSNLASPELGRDGRQRRVNRQQ
jgi:hypothetical protein